jgi:hypothetical protein
MKGGIQDDGGECGQRTLYTCMKPTVLYSQLKRINGGEGGKVRL